MKVLFTLCLSFNPNEGGVQRSTYKIGRYLSEQGIDVYYYSFCDGGHVKPEYGTLFHSQYPGNCQSQENVAHFRKTLHEITPDIVINQSTYDDEVTKALAEEKNGVGYTVVGCLRTSLFNFKCYPRLRLKYILPKPVFTLIDNPIGIGLFQLRHWIKHRHELRTILNRHDKYVLLTPPNRSELEYFVGKYKAEKVYTIPNSIPEVFDVKTQKEKIILHVGRLEVSQKRCDLLIDYWKNVYKELPDWKFVIVGDGPYMDDLKEQIKTYNLPRIQLEGSQKPESYYKKASVFVMFSSFEGFPNVLIEAQSYGAVPVVFDTYAALSWIVNDKKDAILVKPFNTQQMAIESISLAMNDSRMAEMNTASCENARRFTIDRVGQEWLKFFKQLGY